MSGPPPWTWRAGLAAWALLATPPLRHALEGSMSLQMLVQMPLLVLAGVLLAGAVPTGWRRALAAWNLQGIPGLLLASVTGLVWMLPRLLDAALVDPWTELAKFLSLPLLLGVPLALSWRAAGFVVRGVFLLEAVATAFRLGWLYLASPVRLCSNYRLDDQQRLGELLLGLGLAVSLLLAWQLLWGRIDVGSAGD